MQCRQCGNFLAAVACQFGCPTCGYKDGWSINESQFEIVDIKEVENDSERNGTDDGNDIQADPQNERSRTERICEEEE